VALASLVRKAQRNPAFATAPYLHRAVAFGLDNDDAYFASLVSNLQARRDPLVAGLVAVGLSVPPTESACFVTTVFAPLGFNGDDVALYRYLTEQAGVTTGLRLLRRRRGAEPLSWFGARQTA